MTTFSKKLILSVLAVVVTLVTLGTTTFAWFTVTNVANIEALDLQIDSGDGIEISADGQTWFSGTLSKAEINRAQPGVLLNKIFTTATTSDLSSFTSLTPGDPTVSPATPTSGYIVFNLWFRAQTSDQINLHGDVYNSTANTKNWSSDANFKDAAGLQVAPGGSVEIQTDSAMRLAFGEFVPGGTGSSDTSSYATFGYDKDLTTVYESDKNPLGSWADANLATEGNVSYWNAKYPAAQITLAMVTAAKATALEARKFLTKADTGTATGSKVLDLVNDPLAPGAFKYYGKTKVAVWLEGWDKDSYNSLLSEKHTLSLNFRGYSETNTLLSGAEAEVLASTLLDKAITNALTGDVILPATAQSAAVTITWVSSDVTVIGHDGSITNAGTAGTATLTATYSVSGVTSVITYSVTTV